jgi:hypothetical protein
VGGTAKRAADTPEAAHEMKTMFHCANNLCQKAAYVAWSPCPFFQTFKLLLTNAPHQRARA